MPSETFFRLPEEKRQRIFEAAVDEFAAQRFAQASINHIIKTAGIPRGSFYQYFTGKEDLYTYVFQVIGNEKINIISSGQLAAKEEQSLYDLITGILPHIFEWVEQNPRYYRIGMLMLEDSTDFMQTVIDGMPDSLSFIRQLLEKERQTGRMRDGVEPETVLRLIIAAATMIMHAYYESKNAEDAAKRVMAVYDIIFYGALRQEGI